MSLFYDRQGRPIENTHEWALLFEDLDYRVLQQTTIGEYWISTVWVGIDMSLSYDEPRPAIFETLILKDGDEVEMRRYRSEEEAVSDHQTLVEQIELLEAAT